MNARSSLGWIGMALLVVGCSGASSFGKDGPLSTSDAQAYTVSYRNPVRLPADGAVLDPTAFANQLAARDPIGSVRCAAQRAADDVADYLGGFEWSHPVAILKDTSYPPLWSGKQPDMTDAPMASAGASDAAASSAAPVIERPDLVGVAGGIGVFMSTTHGLFSVDARSGTPAMSCAMKLPGEPKNFLIKGQELVAVVNARGNGNRSALLRYAIEGNGFRFIDAVKLDDQTVIDTRLFDSTIVAYTSWAKPRAPSIPTPADPSSVGSNGGSAMASPVAMNGADPDHYGAKVIVVQWDDKLGIDWQDSLLDDPAKQDPTEGSAPGTTYTAGQVVSTRKQYAQFVAASDRYVAIPRTVETTRFDHYETTTYQVCTNYNPQYEQITVCSINYEQRPNPDYKAPDPTTGDYACNGKSLADCIQAAAPVVSQYIYVPVGQTCNPVWQGRCEAYETRSDTYPTFTTDNETEMSIYRFESGSFTKLDSTLSKMTQKADAISFEKDPLQVTGTISARDQIQFQNGQLYVFADNALQTLAVAGNSISYLQRLDLATTTDSSAAIVFSSDRAMISGHTQYDYSSSAVAMLDLSVPSLPKPLTSFTMPGTTTQLILASTGILGPGQVSLANQGVDRSLEKLTLFSKDAGTELDNLLLGTEYDTLTSSWFDPNDDQRIRLGGDRLFLPYSGRAHDDASEPTAHRLNITRVDPTRLVSERSFELHDDIIRTASLDDQRSLVFGNSSAYLVDHTTGDWILSTLREIYTPFATYRLDDANHFAVVSRVGSSCRITTQAGDATVFSTTPIAQADIPCNDNSIPTAFKSAIFFGDTRTGVTISSDAKTITALAPTDVDALAKEQPKGYCRTSDDANGQPVPWLDSIPGHIVCE